MNRGVLSEQEYAALMALFEHYDKGKEGVLPQQKAPAAAVQVQRLQALKTAVETEMKRWQQRLAAMNETEVSVRLRAIARGHAVVSDKERLLYADAHLVLRIAAPFINLVNERSLGARQVPPEVDRPLTELDRALFEVTGAMLFGASEFSYVPRSEGRPYVAYVDIGIVPDLRTTVEVFLHETLSC